MYYLEGTTMKVKRLGGHLESCNGIGDESVAMVNPQHVLFSVRTRLKTIQITALNGNQVTVSFSL
jgi:hypothetical protein